MHVPFAIALTFALPVMAWAGAAGSSLGIVANTTSPAPASSASHAAHGIAALDNGQTAEAVAALERALALEPDNLPLRTELARAYALLGDHAAAARELQTVATNPNTPQTIRENLNTYTNLLTQSLRGGPRTWHASLQAGVGSDSNINTATTSSYMLIPALAALGPAKLEDSATAQSSLFTETTASASVRQPLTPAWAVYAGANASHKQAFTSSAYNQTTLSAETGFQHTSPAGRRLTLGTSARQFWYGADSYSQTYALSGSWYQPLGVSYALATYASAAHNHYPQVPDQNADRLTLGTSLQGFFGPFTTFAGVYGGTEDAETDLNSHAFLGGNAGTEYLLTPRLALNAEARYEHRDYGAENPTFLTTRQDAQLDLSLGLAYALTANLSLRPSVGYRYAHSTLAVADYTRWHSLVALRYTLP